MPPNRIFINGRMLNQAYTGMGTYTRKLIEEWSVDLDKKITVVSHEKTDYQGGKSVEVVVLPEWQILKKIHPGLAKSFWEYWQLPRFCRKKQTQLLFSPYPALSGDVITVHDTIPWEEAKYQRGHLSKLYHQMSLATAKKAKAIITVSKSSAKDLVRFGFESSKITVVWNGAEVCKSNKCEPEVESQIAANTPYLFYFGGFDERKNVVRLQEIYSRSIRPATDLKLVLGGGKVLDNDLFESFEQSGGPGIIKTGFLSEDQLACWLKNSWGFITLSRREGFNIPLAQALKAGCLALYSDIAVHREISDQEGVAIDLDLNDAQIGLKIVQLWKDKNHTRHLRDSIRNRQWGYSWSVSASLTWEILEKNAKIKKKI